MQIKRTVAPILLLALTAALLIQLPIAIADRASAYEWFNPIIDVRELLLKRHVIEPDERAMQEAMIRAMIDSIDDPYTQFVPPTRRADVEKELHGTYVGIGAEVNIVDGELTIVSPMEGSPALEAGILAGDVVLEIEGEPIHGEPINESIERLMGEPGTPVDLKVRHLDGEVQDITVIRRQIVARTLRGLRRHGETWDHCVDDELGLAYIRITQFTESTSGELTAALNDLSSDGLNGLVLDLRDNPGGSLNSAVEIADLFLDEGVVVAVRGRHGEGRSYEASAAGTLPDFPMVVIVNGASASASEIVAGALQDHGRAKILGTRTFGKGSVQELRELPFEEGLLKFTVAHYHRPSGRNINRLPDSTVWGVDPDPGFVLAVSDEQYLQMLRARRDFEVIREANGAAPPCATPEWIREQLHDMQLAAAVETLQAQVSDGTWPRVGEDDATVIAFDQEIQRAVTERNRLIERLNAVDERIGELRESGTDAGRRPLLPEDVDLNAGTITLRDRFGNVVGTYRIDGGNLELALEGLRLTPTEDVPRSDS